MGGSGARVVGGEEDLSAEGGEVRSDVGEDVELMLRGKEEEETVVLYFDSWPKEERCVSLPLKQVLHVNL